jgi:hypothetical protein
VRSPPGRLRVRVSSLALPSGGGQQARGTKLAPNPRDPLYFETETTPPVDFHSFRRAFSTALAEAGGQRAARDEPCGALRPARARALRHANGGDAHGPRRRAAGLALKAVPERVRRDDLAAHDVPSGPGIVSAGDDSGPLPAGAATAGEGNHANAQDSLSSGCRTRTYDPAVNRSRRRSTK